MRAVRRLLVALVAATVLAGCSDTDPTLSAADDSASPTSLASAREILRSASAAARDANAAAKQSALATLIATSQQHLERAMQHRKLRLAGLEYTSPTDAAATLWDCYNFTGRCHTVVVTTDDNWASSAGLAVPMSMADLVDFAPVGEGAVVVKAVDQFEPVSYPPILVRADGTISPLRVSDEARRPGPGTVVLSGGIGDAGAPRSLRGGFWAVDVAAAEAYPLLVERADCCGSWDRVAGRNGAVLSFGGYRRRIGDGAWQFASTRDAGQTWRTTEVDLPLGGPLWDYEFAVGPGRRQAIVITEEEEDQPRTIGELWLTDDERAFHEVRLAWTPQDFGGLAFASDGSLLLAESTGHRLWRLPPGSGVLEPAPHAPRLADDWSSLHISGAVIVARTGRTRAAVSTDGISWVEVSPGA